MNFKGILREEFLITKEYVFMNSASKAPMPISVYNTLKNYYDEYLVKALRPESIVVENYNGLKQKIATLISTKPEPTAMSRQYR